jgi:hypothetical protein
MQSDDFPFIYANQLGTAEQITFVIDDWLPTESNCLLYAPKDHLKSFFAVDWFMSIASGLDWNGFEVLQGACVYIAGEGNAGLGRRMKAWSIRHDVNMESLPIAVSTKPMQVLNIENIRVWTEHLRQILIDLGEPIRLVVIDTLATNFGPGDENSPGDMARFLVNLRTYIQAEFTCSVLIVHHTGKDASRGSRGGSSIEGNADCVFTLKRDGDNNERRVTLHCKHTKDSERPPDIIMKGVPVELGINDKKGRPVTSLVMNMELSALEQSVLTMTKEGKSQRFIAEELDTSKTNVFKILARLRAINLLTKD